MKIPRIIISFTVIVLTAMVMSTSLSAQGSGGIQGYSADTTLDHGTIVQLTGKNSDRVKMATQPELQNMFGVTVDGSRLPVRLANEGLENETYVAVSGTHPVLVSNQAGSIVAGDYVTLSSINGVAMKAGTKEKTVFGRATSSFDGKGVVLGTTTLKDTDGKSNKTVALGTISVTIDIRSNPNEQSTKANVPEPLERIGEAIAEKEVSPIRIYLSMAITFISVVAAIVVLYSGVRNGMISIGRNPMSKKSIFSALLEIILTSLLTLIIGLFAVYLLLKL